MINTIVLDIGNVLAHFGWREYLHNCNYDEDTIDKISRATVCSKLWLEWDRGLKTRDELIEISCSMEPGLEKEIREFFRNTFTMIKEYDYSTDFVKQLKENGYKVYLLSNYSEANFEHDSKSFQFMKYVDGSIISCKIKHVKPEPEIYQALIQTYDINPSEAVFLDDLQINLEAAKEFGFHTVLMKSYNEAMDEFRRVGIRI